jgi:ACR3 family arsenite efflux pump ArsB
MRAPDAGPVSQWRIVIAATVCTLAIAVAVARGGLESGGTAALVVLLLVFVRVAFRLVDEAERREEERDAGR